MKLFRQLLSKSDNQTVKSHGLIAKLFHWGFILLFVYGLSKQLDEVTQLEDVGLLVFEMVFAVIFLAVLLMRFLYMRSAGSTALPEDTSAIVKKLARYGHLAMYISLSMVAVSGLCIGGLYWFGIKTGLVMDSAVGLHELSMLATLLFILLHVLAAIYHRILGDGIWSSMVPVLKERNRD